MLHRCDQGSLPPRAMVKTGGDKTGSLGPTACPRQQSSGSLVEDEYHAEGHQRSLLTLRTLHQRWTMVRQEVEEMVTVP